VIYKITISRSISPAICVSIFLWVPIRADLTILKHFQATKMSVALFSFFWITSHSSSNWTHVWPDFSASTLRPGPSSSPLCGSTLRRTSCRSGVHFNLVKFQPPVFFANKIDYYPLFHNESKMQFKKSFLTMQEGLC